MKQNVGSADSYARFMLGLMFIINIYILETGAIGTIILLALTASMWFSAWSHYCWAYAPFKISTAGCTGECEEEESKE